MIWLIADTHFWHKNIKEHCTRPASWQKVLISRWQASVADSDTVIHLGDVVFKRSVAQTRKLMDSLPGKKILIRGNHDGSVTWVKKAGFVTVYRHGDQFEIEDQRFEVLQRRLHLRSVGTGDVLYLEDDVVVLSHRPIPGVRQPYFFGHVHNSQVGLAGVYGRCVSVEVINYAPIPLDVLLRGPE